MGTNVIDGVPIEGGSGEEGNGRFGGHGHALPKDTVANAGATALAVASPAFGGIYRDLIVPVWDSDRAVVSKGAWESAGSAAKRFGCRKTGQHKAKYGFKFVVEQRKRFLRIFYLMPGPGVTAAVGQQALQRCGNLTSAERPSGR